MSFTHPNIHKWLKSHAECGKMMTAKTQKLCTACEHCEAITSSWSFPMGPSYQCRRAQPLRDLVSGKVITLYCDSERDEGPCGPKAKFFTPKKKKKAEKNAITD